MNPVGHYPACIVIGFTAKTESFMASSAIVDVLFQIQPYILERYSLNS
jgi:hypothetical protein